MDKESINEIIRKTVESKMNEILAIQLVKPDSQENLQEYLKKDAKVLFDNGDGTQRELPFGHPMHIKDMKRTLEGLCRIRNCYKPGSGRRLVFAAACSALSKLIERHSCKEEIKSSVQG